jgi:hypothetical protein
VVATQKRRLLFIIQIIRIGINRTLYCHLQLSCACHTFRFQCLVHFLSVSQTPIPCNPLSSICLSYLVHYTVFFVSVLLCLFWTRQCVLPPLYVASAQGWSKLSPQSLRDNKKFVLRITVWTSRANWHCTKESVAPINQLASTANCMPWQCGSYAHCSEVAWLYARYYLLQKLSRWRAM